jgi:hypothetical protein
MFRSLIDRVPDEIEVLEDENGFVTIVPFAESEDGNKLASIDCHARRAEYDGRSFYEFCFEISVTPVDDSNEDIMYIQAPEVARNFIPVDVKPFLLPTACKCYEKLAEATGRPPIYRVTYAANPSEEALRKHEKITEALQNAGYAIEEAGTDELGRAFWMMVTARNPG